MATAVAWAGAQLPGAFASSCEVSSTSAPSAEGLAQACSRCMQWVVCTVAAARRGPAVRSVTGLWMAQLVWLAAEGVERAEGRPLQRGGAANRRFLLLRPSFGLPTHPTCPASCLQQRLELRDERGRAASDHATPAAAMAAATG